MKKPIVLILTALLMYHLPMSAQKKNTATPAANTCEIEVLLHGAQPSDTLFLKAYDGDKILTVDSVKVSVDGKAIFRKKTPLAMGMYGLELGSNNNQPLDFLISDGEPQRFRVTYAQVDGLASAHFDGSTENEALADYTRYVKQQQNHMQTLQDRMQRYMQRPDSAASISRQMEQLFNDVKARWASIEENYKGKMLALFIMSVRESEPEPFDPPQTPGINVDSLEREYYYYFFKDHFFDNHDFSSPYILKMPFYGKAVSTYFMRVVKPDKNEVQLCVDSLMKKAERNNQVYKYTVNHLTRMFREAPYPDLNELSIYIGETYVVNRPEMWNDAEYVARVADMLAKAKLNPAGSIATNLKLQDPSGNWIALHDVQAPFTVLYFFNPLCHSCAVVTPQLHLLYEQYRNKGLKVYAVYVDHRRSDWEPYITEKGLLNWINVWDPDEKGSAGVYDKYDVHAIPTLYLLDKDKKVIAKDLFPNTLEMWLQQLMQ